MFFEEKKYWEIMVGTWECFGIFFVIFIFYNLNVEVFVGIRGLEIWFCFYFIYLNVNLVVFFGFED